MGSGSVPKIFMLCFYEHKHLQVLEAIFLHQPTAVAPHCTVLAAKDKRRFRLPRLPHLPRVRVRGPKLRLPHVKVGADEAKTVLKAGECAGMACH
jgi:hypothetical protein